MSELEGICMELVDAGITPQQWELIKRLVESARRQVLREVLAAPGGEYEPNCEHRHTWTEASGSRCVCGAHELVRAVVIGEDGAHTTFTSRPVTARG
jgi:hypothetical protein